AARLAGVELVPGALRLVRLSDQGEGELLDEALAWCESPRRVGLHLPGSPPLVRRVLAHFGGDHASARAAASLEERAEELLASAPSEAGARMLLDQAEGALRRELEAWRDEPTASVLARALRLLERSRVALYALEPALVVLAGPVNAGK